MPFSVHTSHRAILLLPAGLYVVLVLLCAVWPALRLKAEEARTPRPPHDALVERGRAVYRSFNCVTCHTQQVRGYEAKAFDLEGRRVVPVFTADARFGTDAASTAREYDWQDPPLLGTQRTGPDLLGVGLRLPGAQWHYWHLYAPRSVSPDSLMPPHAFLFTKDHPPPAEAMDYDEVVPIEGLGLEPGERLWATPDAKALVEYLLSLKREALGGTR